MLHTSCNLLTQIEARGGIVKWIIVLAWDVLHKTTQLSMSVSIVDLLKHAMNDYWYDCA